MQKQLHPQAHWSGPVAQTYTKSLQHCGLHERPLSWSMYKTSTKPCARRQTRHSWINRKSQHIFLPRWRPELWACVFWTVTNTSLSDTERSLPTSLSCLSDKTQQVNGWAPHAAGEKSARVKTVKNSIKWTWGPTWELKHAENHTWINNDSTVTTVNHSKCKGESSVACKPVWMLLGVFVQPYRAWWVSCRDTWTDIPFINLKQGHVLLDKRNVVDASEDLSQMSPCTRGGLNECASTALCVGAFANAHSHTPHQIQPSKMSNEPWPTFLHGFVAHVGKKYSWFLYINHHINIHIHIHIHHIYIYTISKTSSSKPELNRWKATTKWLATKKIEDDSKLGTLANIEKWTEWSILRLSSIQLAGYWYWALTQLHPIANPLLVARCCLLGHARQFLWLWGVCRQGKLLHHHALWFCLWNAGTSTGGMVSPQVRKATVAWNKDHDWPGVNRSSTGVLNTTRMSLGLDVCICYSWPPSWVCHDPNRHVNKTQQAVISPRELEPWSLSEATSRIERWLSPNYEWPLFTLKRRQSVEVTPKTCHPETWHVCFLVI